LFPNGDFTRGVNPKQLVGINYANFDPASAVPMKDGDKIGAKFDISLATMKKLGLTK
jgi:hypothetical protein